MALHDLHQGQGLLIASSPSSDAAWEPHGRALLDFFRGDLTAEISAESSLGETETVPASVWFRGEEALFPLDRAALALARGSVLDVGAGAGAHSLPLQARGLRVCAIDRVPQCVEILRARGVRDARQVDVLAFRAGRFDTVLLLANGAGIAETLAGLDRLLGALQRLVAPSGAILLDSTDLRDHPAWREPAPDGAAYFGELVFRLRYRGLEGPPFRQLYVDPKTLGARAQAAGWRCEVVGRDGRAYLARLTHITGGPRSPTPRSTA
jgi:2-polyprenyl-3-methyl-5-hydroxy-6-metoxy-1,4-benzoquinol methylase